MNRLTYKVCVLIGVLKHGENFFEDYQDEIYICYNTINIHNCLFVTSKFLYDSWIGNFLFLAWVFAIFYGMVPHTILMYLLFDMRRTYLALLI